MLSVKERGIILQIITHCERVVSKIENLTREDFDEDLDNREIICFNLFQIGELAKKVIG